MRYQITLREANQNFSQYIKEIEAGNEIVVTRRGEPVAIISKYTPSKKPTPDQLKARSKLIKMMQKGLSLKGEVFKRDELYDD